jgi:hypothetical protein
MKAEIKTRRQVTWGPPLGLLTMLREMKREEILLPLQKGGLWECVVTENGQHVPFTWREPAKISKSMLAENVATHPQNVKKIYVLQQKFSAYKNQKYKVLKRPI